MRIPGALTLFTAAACAAAGDRVVEGNVASPVKVVIYEDLQCPDCAELQRMMDEQLLPKYKNTVAFEHRDFPLAKHAWARKAAIAARYFDSVSPELGLEFRRYALQNLRQIKVENFSEKLAEFARNKGQAPAAAQAALNDPAPAEKVERDFQEGVARGVSRTPTVFVGGQPFVETFTFEEISRGIDAAIKESQ